MLLDMGMNDLGNLLGTMAALSRFGIGSDWIRIVLRLFELFQVGSESFQTVSYGLRVILRLRLIC